MLFRTNSPEVTVATNVVVPQLEALSAYQPSTAPNPPSPLQVRTPSGGLINFCDLCIAGYENPDAMDASFLLSVIRRSRSVDGSRPEEMPDPFEIDDPPATVLAAPDTPLRPTQEAYTDVFVAGRVAALTEVLMASRRRQDLGGVRVVAREIRAWRRRTPPPLPKLAAISVQ
jgi:hypothetical protein